MNITSSMQRFEMHILHMLKGTLLKKQGLFPNKSVATLALVVFGIFIHCLLSKIM